MQPMSPELPTPITPSGPDLPVEPDSGPATPTSPPSDASIPVPGKAPHPPTLFAWQARANRHFMRAAAFRWRGF
ncbi:Uncharacterised protein [Xylophilus ampelinus]|nr:hypothetical protein [Variovorax sp.]VTY35651.1 Uncharacterised protein [Xylophilus ampelinus]